jgi:hypothetical protein
MNRPWKPTANERRPGRDLRPLAALFPLAAANDVEAALAFMPLDTSRRLDNGQLLRPPDFYSREARLITWRGTLLAVPYRLYVQEPAAEEVRRLTSPQQQVLHWLYLRHSDGYLRQRYLKALFALSNGSPEAFTVPFTFSLLGEYVQELLAVLLASLTPALLASYVALIKENPLYWQQTCGRVASYRDIYYRSGRRGSPRFRHYVGARLLARLQQALVVAGEKQGC